MWENGPEKVEKKNTVAHSTPDVTPRKKKEVRSVRGTICGVFRYMKKIKCFWLRYDKTNRKLKLTILNPVEEL